MADLRRRALVLLLGGAVLVLSTTETCSRAVQSSRCLGKRLVDLGNLFALAAAAKAEQSSGTIVIQTLGLSGSEVSGLIPMPGEVSQATIQNAILALASIKAKM